MRHLTDDQIERHVEYTFDRYDAALMDGLLSQEAYDALARDLNIWADKQYRLTATAALRHAAVIRSVLA